jgi:uncharacterized repeat protein (TIGR02543 family)
MKHPNSTWSILKPIAFLLAFMVIAHGADSDFDGLDDAVETNTGVFVSPSNTGTNPSAADSDGDGVPDGLEVKEKTSPVDATKFNSFSKGLAGYWEFDASYADTSGNQIDFVTTPYCDFSVVRNNNSNESLRFTNIAGRATSSKSINISENQDRTISYWCKLPQSGHTISVGWGTNPGTPSTPGTASSLVVDSEGRVIHWGSYADIESNVRIMPKIWNHVVISYKNNFSEAKIAINGKVYSHFNGSLNTLNQLNTSNTAIKISGYAFGDISNQSMIDSVRVYRRALTDLEINQLYKREAPKLQIIEGSYTWHQAKADAESRGGRLAELDTQFKIDEANRVLSALGSWPEIWIGMTDEAQEGLWRWVSGSIVSNAPWSPTEPNGSGNYGLIYGSGHAVSGLWDDQPSSNSKSYFLETLRTIWIDTSIQNGSITGSGQYETNTTATLTATPNLGYRFTGWTGDASGTTNPLTITMDADKTVGATFEKDLSDTDSDGLTAYDELVVYAINPALADTDGDGLNDGYELGVGRFSIVTGSFTWQQARTDARSKGGDLASFPTEDRWNRAMQNLAANPFEDFTGLWIGASDAAVDGTWTWVNGESFSFAPWGTGRPSSTSGNSLYFAEVSGGGGAEIGKWYDRSPTTIRDGYLLEMGYATSPTVADADGDGLNDGQEQTAGTSPTNADTDGDGLSDGQEINLTGTNPKLADTNGDGTNDAASDQDDDGLSNLAEISTHGTDAIKADTDGDGLSDGFEINYPGRYFTLVEGSFTHAQAIADATTRRGRLANFPNASDFTRVAGRARKATQGYLWFGLSDAATEGTWLWTDGSTPTYTRWLNGQPDGGTTENHAVLMEASTQWADAVADFVAAGYLFERVGLDPLATDTDGDGLSDGAESNTHQTNPVLDDSDSDGLTDGAEINTHGSNPKLSDTDSDGLSDFAEVVTHRTNPSAKDSDADGFDDLFEINTGFNPTQNSSTPDAVSYIRTAVEFRFNAGNGLRYRIEGSTDLQNWETVETDINGTGGVITRFYSIENQPKRYFRVKRN